MTKFLVAVILCLAPQAVYAYVPPGFFLAHKIASGREAASTILTHIEVYRAAQSTKEADEILWDELVQLSADSAENSWPGLSILVEPNKENLIAAFKQFGLPVIAEEALARFKGDQLRAMKETPRPFYNVDPNMSLRRNGRQLAWVLSSQDNERSLWVEKNSFFPLFLRGPCPKSVEEISWADNDEGPCELHFESISGFRTSAGKRTSAVLKRGSESLVKFVIKRTVNNPSAQALKDLSEKNSKSTASAGDLLPLVKDFMN